MFKIYQLNIFKKFLIKYFYFNLIFLTLIIIMGILEEISFFKNLDKGIFYPLILTILNAPNTLFEIIPFICLLSTQFLFYDLFNTNELDLLKRNGLSNFKLIKNLFLCGLFIGVFNILFFYNISSIMKFNYSNIKNNFSNDNKYLAMVNESGLWIKDNIENKSLIIKAQKIENNFLYEVLINEFNKNFELIRVIRSKKIDIDQKNWLIHDPEIIIDNIKDASLDKIILKTNFDNTTINSFFSDITTLNIISLYNSKKNLERLGYSSNEISIQMLRLIIMPIYYGILIVLASIIMFYSKEKSSLIFNLIVGITISVLLYYITFIFNAMGNNDRISPAMSVFFPILLLFLLSSAGIVKINEK
jgi:lipopolysaccharide export system permease protein